MTITEIEISHVETLGDNRFYFNQVMNELSMNVWSYELFVDEHNIDVSLCDYINCLEWYEDTFNNYEFSPMFAEPDDISDDEQDERRELVGVQCAPAA